MKNVFEKWDINEGLLQSYRQIFISVQSFLLAVGAFMVDKSLIIFAPITIFSVLFIWYIWFPVVKSRHKIVDYYKYLAKGNDHSSEEIISEREYVKDVRKRKEFNKEYGIKSNWRKTRYKLDLILPILFSILWLILLLYNICTV